MPYVSQDLRRRRWAIRLASFSGAQEGPAWQSGQHTSTCGSSTATKGGPDLLVVSPIPMGDFMKKIEEIRIAAEYTLIRKLDKGGFGVVYLSVYQAITSELSNYRTGENLDTGKGVALELEHRSVEPSLLGG